MELSKRTAWNLSENEFAVAVRARRATGATLLDLTRSNPTQCGFDYDEQALLAPLHSPLALRYEPEPLGMHAARVAVARYYEDHGATVPLDRICLTTSTSEAYSFLFRLLCNPGDDVLVAQPSYPLFDFIAQLDDVALRSYPLWFDPSADHGHGHGWSIDLATLEAAIGPHTKALILVHPNNPTGQFASAEERVALETLCARHGLALLVDEVFLDYALEGCAQPSFATGEVGCLTFVLSGLSKICGLPQMKASWIVARGPEPMVQSAMERLEVIADTFLSMNAPIQHALPTWLGQRAGLQQQVRQRMQRSLSVLDRELLGSAISRYAMQGGWTAVLRVPRSAPEFCLLALDAGVLLQPGTFYGLADGHAVVSLLTPPELWDAGLAILTP
jgi:aspartate/methionine/tyrosine aminotransferase